MVARGTVVVTLVLAAGCRRDGAVPITHDPADAAITDVAEREAKPIDRGPEPIRITRRDAVMAVANAGWSFPHPSRHAVISTQNIDDSPPDVCSSTDAACVWRITVTFRDRAVVTPIATCAVHAVTGAIACTEPGKPARVVGTAVALDGGLPAP